MIGTLAAWAPRTLHRQASNVTAESTQTRPWSAPFRALSAQFARQSAVITQNLMHEIQRNDGVAAIHLKEESKQKRAEFDHACDCNSCAPEGAGAR